MYSRRTRPEAAPGHGLAADERLRPKPNHECARDDGDAEADGVPGERGKDGVHSKCAGSLNALNLILNLNLNLTQQAERAAG